MAVILRRRAGFVSSDDVKEFGRAGNTADIMPLPEPVIELNLITKDEVST